MSRYVLIPGAGGSAWYWSRVAARLESAGHTAVAVDLPGDDEAAGLPTYVDLTCTALGGHPDTVLVAQSLGGFTAAMAAERTTPRAIVLVNAMIPRPGERAGEWWDATGSGPARVAAAERCGYPVEFDVQTYFLHDVDPAVAAEGQPFQRPEADAVFASVCDFTAWPDIPVRVLSGAADRFFPVEFQQRIARDRLCIEPDVLPGGHLIALSQPDALSKYLAAI